MGPRRRRAGHCSGGSIKGGLSRSIGQSVLASLESGPPEVQRTCFIMLPELTVGVAIEEGEWHKQSDLVNGGPGNYAAEEPWHQVPDVHCKVATPPGNPVSRVAFARISYSYPCELFGTVWQWQKTNPARCRQRFPSQAWV